MTQQEGGGSSTKKAGWTHTVVFAKYAIDDHLDMFLFFHDERRPR